MKNRNYIVSILSILGIGIGIFLLFASSAAPLLAEIAETAEIEEGAVAATPDGDVASTAAEESPQTDWLNAGKDAPDEGKGIAGESAFPKLTKILQSIAIVMLLIVGTVFFLKKKYGIASATGKKYMHVVESVPIGSKRFLLMVKIPGKLLILGMANDNINSLAEITDKEVVDTISPSSDNNNNNFLSSLKKFYSGEMSGVGKGTRE